jgi:hypothetical protein
MANHQRTAADVAQLESDNEHYRNENERLERDLAIVTADRNRLQVENAMIAGNARENLIKATRMETIVRQVSAGLVSALNELTQERKVQGEMRRQVQVEQMEEETGAPPAFLRQQRSGDPTRAVARAAEMIAPPRAPTPARIDHTIADKDPRLPPASYGSDQDDDELARLGGNIQSR